MDFELGRLHLDRFLVLDRLGQPVAIPMASWDGWAAVYPLIGSESIFFCHFLHSF